MNSQGMFRVLAAGVALCMSFLAFGSPALL